MQQPLCALGRRVIGRSILAASAVRQTPYIQPGVSHQHLPAPRLLREKKPTVAALTRDQLSVLPTRVTWVRFVPILLLVVGLGACSKSNPVAPTAENGEQEAVETVVAQMQHPDVRVHNLPATMEDDPGGPLFYVCETQPRQYCGTSCTWERDHYISRSECPAEPIE